MRERGLEGFRVGNGADGANLRGRRTAPQKPYNRVGRAYSHPAPVITPPPTLVEGLACLSFLCSSRGTPMWMQRSASGIPQELSILYICVCVCEGWWGWVPNSTSPFRGLEPSLCEYQSSTLFPCHLRHLSLAWNLPIRLG